MKLSMGLSAVLLASTTLLPGQTINIDLGQPGAPRPPDCYRERRFAQGIRLARWTACPPSGIPHAIRHPG